VSVSLSQTGELLTRVRPSDFLELRLLPKPEVKNVLPLSFDDRRTEPLQVFIEGSNFFFDPAFT
jgi:hypothetical protein